MLIEMRSTVRQKTTAQVPRFIISSGHCRQYLGAVAVSSSSNQNINNVQQFNRTFRYTENINISADYRGLHQERECRIPIFPGEIP